MSGSDRDQLKAAIDRAVRARTENPSSPHFELSVRKEAPGDWMPVCFLPKKVRALLLSHAMSF